MKRLAIALVALTVLGAAGVGGVYWLLGRVRTTQPESVARVSDDKTTFPVTGFPGQGIALKNKLHLAHVNATEPVDCVECHQLNPEQPRADHRCERCHEEKTSALHQAVHNDQARECLSCHDFFRLPKAGRDPWACASCHVADHADVPKGYAGALHQPDAPLIVQHKDEDCRDCHKPHDGPGIVIRECVECHKDISTGHSQAQKNRKGVEVCMDCHAVHEAKDAADRHCRRCHKKDVKARALFRDGHVKCVNCHAPHDFTKNAAKKCANCHKGQKVLAEKEPKHGTCEKCHTPHDARTGRKSCFSSQCHAKLKRDHPKDEKLGLCLGCHVVHPRDKQPEVGTLSCESCHAKGQDATAYHRGKGKGKGKKLAVCSDCHKPHKSVKQAKNNDKLCRSCHKERVGGATAIVTVKGHDKCETCHKKAAHEPALARPSCQSCHKEQFAEAPEKHRECEKCHSTHDGFVTRACTNSACHKPKEWRGRHDKIDKSCAACHRAHGPKGKAKPPKCLDCHKTKELPGIHQHEEHQKCSDCHETHDTRVLGTRRVCVDSCHKKLAKHEPNARSCVGCHPFIKSK